MLIVHGAPRGGRYTGVSMVGESLIKAIIIDGQPTARWTVPSAR